MGAQTAEANYNAGVAAAKQILNYFDHDDLRFQVNKPGKYVVKCSFTESVLILRIYIIKGAAFAN